MRRTEGKAEAQRTVPVPSATGKIEMCRSRFMFSPKLIEKKFTALKIELTLLR